MISSHARKLGEYDRLRSLNHYLENANGQHQEFLLNQGQLATQIDIKLQILEKNIQTLQKAKAK